MANMFEKYAADLEAGQKNIEKAVIADTAAEEKRTTLSLSLTVSDKKTLKKNDGCGARYDNCRNHS